MTKIEDIERERKQLQQMITNEEMDGKDTSELSTRLWHLTDELVTLKGQDDKRKKGDCLYE